MVKAAVGVLFHLVRRVHPGGTDAELLSRTSLAGETMKETPTQLELTEAVKTVFRALGGKVVAALAAAFALSAPASGASPRWGDVDPTNTIDRVLGDYAKSDATRTWVSNNFVTVLDFDEFRTAVNASIAGALDSAKAYADDLLDSADIEAAAAAAASNTVEAVLAPRSLEFAYGPDGGETALVAPNWAVSPLKFTRDGPGDEPGGGTAYLYSNGRLRNYAVVIEEIPQDCAGRALAFDFSPLRESHRLYASPDLYEYEYEYGDLDRPLWGWLLSTNDVPCVVTLREPEEGTLILRREKLEVQNAAEPEVK